MTVQSPYEKLGVKETASFEEIQDAKKRLSDRHREDNKIVESIEAAYDAIIMDRLRLRAEGKIKVPDRIRFAEPAVEKSSPTTSVTENNSPSWVQDLIDTPTSQDILWPAGVFLTLATWTSVAGKDPAMLSLPIAFGFMATVYFLNRKENRFGRSLLIGFIGLVVAIALGNGLGNLLAIAQGSGNLLSVEQFTTLVIFSFFWLISSFLR